MRSIDIYEEFCDADIGLREGTMHRFIRFVVFVPIACNFCMPANAQPATPSMSNIEDLVITKDQTYNLIPGGHRFRNIDIGENAKITVSGPTTILVGKIKSDKGAKIEYIKGSFKDGPKPFSVSAIDATDIKELTIIASGKDADSFVKGQRAQDGPPGRGASSRFVKGDWYEVPYYKNDTSTPGGGGFPGISGNKGEDAMDVTLYLPSIRPGASIMIEAIGGNGGRGQDGGAGGQGGGASKFHTASNGGPGGAAGAGGPGGSTGKISVFLVVGPAEATKKDEVIKSITFRPTYGAGNGGAPGDPGPGGTAGDSSDHFCIGAGCGSGTGPAGVTADVGPSGAGPRKGEINPNWAVIDVMDLPTYQQYVTQVWTQMSK